MNDSEWQRESLEALSIVAEIFDGNCGIVQQIEDFLPHRVLAVSYADEFELSRVAENLINRLNEIDWQMVSLPFRIDFSNHPNSLAFGIAKIERVEADKAYHATPAKNRGNIFLNGLLPSNPDRSNTRFVDTGGKIHVSLELHSSESHGDGAAHWRDSLSATKSEPYIIIEVDLTQLPSTARVYRDLRSGWGIVIDRVDSISPELIREVDGE